MPLQYPLGTQLLAQQAMGVPTQPALAQPQPVAQPVATPEPSAFDQYVSELGDPTSVKSALLNFAAQALQPRQRGQSSASIIAQALAGSVGELGKARQKKKKASKDEELRQAQLQALGAQTEATKAKTAATNRSTSSMDLADDLTEAKTQALLAAADKDRKGGSKLPAAEVQTRMQLAKALIMTNPGKYQGESGQSQALLDAETFKKQAATNPDLWYANKVADVIEAGAGIASPKELSTAIQQLGKVKQLVEQGLVGSQGGAAAPAQGGSPATPMSDTEILQTTKDALTEEPGQSAVLTSGPFAGSTPKAAIALIQGFRQNPRDIDFYLSQFDPNTQAAYKAQIMQMLQGIPQR